ncbi:MAG: hypothetical protein ACWGQW_12930, partial [bacterium]
MKKYASRLTALLAHPLTQDMDIDDPDVTHLRRQIILQNSFLKQLYLEWYHRIDQALDKPETQRVLELGSGAGFITDVMPDTITSEILPG